MDRAMGLMLPVGMGLTLTCCERCRRKRSEVASRAYGSVMFLLSMIARRTGGNVKFALLLSVLAVKKQEYCRACI